MRYLLAILVVANFGQTQNYTIVFLRSATPGLTPEIAEAALAYGREVLPQAQHVVHRLVAVHDITDQALAFTRQRWQQMEHSA